jgi:PTS system nitrogen regulatory IIA component
MQLRVRDLIQMFGVTETTILRWIRQQDLPTLRVVGQQRFNRLEVLEWAIAHHIKMDTTLTGADSQSSVSLAKAMQAGGIHHNLPGKGLEASLRSVASFLPLPENADAKGLLRILLARGVNGFLAMGGGIIVPRADRPIVLQTSRSFVTLCSLRHPITVPSLNSSPVRSIFTVISQQTTAHVQLLAKLSRALAAPRFRKSVLTSCCQEEILREARRFEEAKLFGPGGSPRAA